MSEKTKSLIRHILTALGLVLSVVGLGKYSGVIDYALANMDGVFEAISTLVGFAMMVYGFFKDSARFGK